MKKLDLLYKAFHNATYDTDEDDALLKDGISILPENIISIERFEFE